MTGAGAPMDPPAGRWALVGFMGRCDLPWLRLLKPGFRHCFVLLHDGRRWLLLDPLAHGLALRALDESWQAELLDALLAEGHLLVPVRPRPRPRRCAPLAPFTCVEAVKRLLGVRCRRIVTPWQLFRHLTRVEHVTDSAKIGKKTLT